MVGGFPRLGIPLLGLAARAFVTAQRRRDVDRRDLVTRANLFGDFDGGDDRRLRVDHGRIRLEDAPIDPERPAASTEASDVNVSGSRHLLKHSGFAFEDRCRPGQSCTGEPRGKYGVAARFGHRDALPFRKITCARQPERNVIVNGESNRVGELLWRQLHQSPGGKRHGRQPKDRRVPSARRNVEGVVELAVDLVGKRDRRDKLLRAVTCSASATARHGAILSLGWIAILPA